MEYLQKIIYMSCIHHTFSNFYSFEWEPLETTLELVSSEHSTHSYMNSSQLKIWKAVRGCFQYGTLFASQGHSGCVCVSVTVNCLSYPHTLGSLQRPYSVKVYSGLNGFRYTKFAPNQPTVMRGKLPTEEDRGKVCLLRKSQMTPYQPGHFHFPPTQVTFTFHLSHSTFTFHPPRSLWRGF